MSISSKLLRLDRRAIRVPRSMAEDGADDKQAGEAGQHGKEDEDGDDRRPRQHDDGLCEHETDAGEAGGDGVGAAVENHRDADHAHREDDGGEDAAERHPREDEIDVARIDEAAQRLGEIGHAALEREREDDQRGARP